MKSLFALNKEERWIALVALIVLLVLNAMLINQYSPLFLKCGKVGYWSVFSKNFRMSGYDCWSYITLSNLRIHFETPRHPLFLSLLWPLHYLNKWLMDVTGVNCAVHIMSVLTMFCGTYSMVFLHRVFRKVMDMSRIDAILLTLLFFSFAHVAVAMIVPDHFVLSLFLLTMTLWITGNAMKEGRRLPLLQWALMLFLTAGITLTNGAKTVLAACFCERRRVLNWHYITGAVMVPLLVLACLWWWQYDTLEVPQQRTTQRIEENLRKKKGNDFDRHVAERGQWMKEHSGEPVSDLPLLSMTDVTTPRLPVVIENFFGESIQLHRDYLLQDMSHTRPVVVKYRWAGHYVIEALMVLLLAAGLFAGRRNRFMLMCMSWLAVDIMLHLVLGFGINEVYIMTADWIFIIPIAIASLMGSLPKKGRWVLRTVVALTAVWLLAYNGSLIVDYLSIPYKLLPK